MRRIKLILFIIILITTIICCFKQYFNSNMDKYYIGIDNLDIFNSLSDEIVYFGRPTCKECREFETIINKRLKSYNISIYYLNTDYWRDKSEIKEVYEKYQVNDVPKLIYVHSSSEYEAIDSVEELDSILDKSPGYIASRFINLIAYITVFSLLLILTVSMYYSSYVKRLLYLLTELSLGGILYQINMWEGYLSDIKVSIGQDHQLFFVLFIFIVIFSIITMGIDTIKNSHEQQ